MKSLRLLAVAALALSAVVGLSACANTPVVAPVVVNTGDIQGSTVTVPLNSTVDLNTGSLAVDSYTATIADTSIAQFVQGHTDNGATFNPGIKPLKVGSTQVTLANKQGGIQNVVFTLKVVAAGGAADLKPIGGGGGGSGH